MHNFRLLILTAVASLSSFGNMPKCIFAQGLIPLDVSFVSQDDYFTVLNTSYAVASQDITVPTYIMAGHGTTIGVATQVLRGIDTTQGQWRLTNGDSPAEVRTNANGAIPIDTTRLHTLFDGFDPSMLGYQPSGSLPGRWPAGSPSYAALLSAARLITITGISTGSTGSVDVTSYMNSLTTHSDESGNFVDPGFLIELPGAVPPNGTYVLLGALYLDNRDGSPAKPWLPTNCEGPTCHFVSAPNNGWVDPDIASGFTYTMTDGSLFTKIDNFPTGFDSPFTVSVNNIVLGQFSPGESVDFTHFPGGGVPSFEVQGISPAVDPTNQLSFPIQLQFNNPTANFDMVAVPEPSTLAILGSAFGGALICRRLGRRPDKSSLLH